MSDNTVNQAERKIALCYVRQSFTREDKLSADRKPENDTGDSESERGSDLNSPKRQRANIQAVCDRNGWIPEWYQDAEGHKSGTNEKNRPGWLALKQRLNDPDVIALVGNDLSRLHRKGWRVGDLIDYLDQYGVRLVLAAPGREIDLSTPMGRLFVQFTAILDEWYAADISARAKDNIAHRKAQGQSVGMPPFGTVRGADGYLKPTPDGVWLLTDGTFVAGEADKPPENGKLWRGYHDAVHFILSLYSTGEYGLEKIAYRFNEAGWAFRDRAGTPRLAERDDIRRVVANWPEYGGLVLEHKAKDRKAYEKINVDEIPFIEERAVFPLRLLRSVAQVRQERTMKPADQGVNRISHFYALAGISYCAHCEHLAEQHNNPAMRSVFGGTNTYGKMRYRHKAGITCGCTNRSVLCDVYESDFTRLIKLLTVSPEGLSLMTELAIQADKARNFPKGDVDPEKEKEQAIALCKRRVEAARHLYMDGELGREEYVRVRNQNQREIAHWQARTSETEQLALELAMCVEANLSGFISHDKVRARD